MKKMLISNGLIVLIAVFSPILLAPIVQAADEQSVTATVTVTNVSLTVSDGSIAYGIITTSSTNSTVSSELNDSQVVTNNGNVAIDVKVKGVDVSPWTLGATAGADVYTHKTCTATCDSTPTWAAMTTSYGTAILSNLATSGTADVDFQIGTPTSTASFTEKNVNVSLLALEH